MEERVKNRLAELAREHEELWRSLVTSDLWRRLQAIEGGIAELSRLLPPLDPHEGAETPLADSPGA